MSFPSVQHFISQGLAPADALLAAVRHDCPEAVEYLHQKAHQVQKSGGPVLWSENPNSPLGKQLIRIHASDAVRPLVEQHVCHGERLQFVNCCSGQVGGKKKEPGDLIKLQIDCQMGPVAYADC